MMTKFLAEWGLGLLVLMMVFSGCSKGQQVGVQSKAERPVSQETDGYNMMMNSEEHEVSMPNCGQMMMNHLGPADENYDKRFINMMIPHHKQAINMAQDAMQKSQHPEIKKMAQKMIQEQQKEIEQLSVLEQKWYGESVSETTRNQ